MPFDSRRVRSKNGQFWARLTVLLCSIAICCSQDDSKLTRFYECNHKITRFIGPLIYITDEDKTLDTGVPSWKEFYKECYQRCCERHWCYFITIKERKCFGFPRQTSVKKLRKREENFLLHHNSLIDRLKHEDISKENEHISSQAGYERFKRSLSKNYGKNKKARLPTSTKVRFIQVKEIHPDAPLPYVIHTKQPDEISKNSGKTVNVSKIINDANNILEILDKDSKNGSTNEELLDSETFDKTDQDIADISKKKKHHEFLDLFFNGQPRFDEDEKRDGNQDGVFDGDQENNAGLDGGQNGSSHGDSLVGDKEGLYNLEKDVKSEINTLLGELEFGENTKLTNGNIPHHRSLNDTRVWRNNHTNRVDGNKFVDDYTKRDHGGDSKYGENDHTMVTNDGEWSRSNNSMVNDEEDIFDLISSILEDHPGFVKPPAEVAKTSSVENTTTKHELGLDNEKQSSTNYTSDMKYNIQHSDIDTRYLKKNHHENTTAFLAGGVSYNVTLDKQEPPPESNHSSNNSMVQLHKNHHRGLHFNQTSIKSAQDLSSEKKIIKNNISRQNVRNETKTPSSIMVYNETGTNQNKHRNFEDLNNTKMNKNLREGILNNTVKLQQDTPSLYTNRTSNNEEIPVENKPVESTSQNGSGSEPSEVMVHRIFDVGQAAIEAGENMIEAEHSHSDKKKIYDIVGTKNLSSVGGYLVTIGKELLNHGKDINPNVKTPSLHKNKPEKYNKTSVRKPQKESPKRQRILEDQIQLSKSGSTACNVEGVHKNVTLRGGMRSGQFTPHGEIKETFECVRKCCNESSCDLSLVINNECFLVHCYHWTLCQVIPYTGSTRFRSEITQVRKHHNEAKHHRITTHPHNTDHHSQRNDTPLPPHHTRNIMTANHTEAASVTINPEPNIQHGINTAMSIRHNSTRINSSFDNNHKNTTKLALPKVVKTERKAPKSSRSTLQQRQESLDNMTVKPFHNASSHQRTKPAKMRHKIEQGDLMCKRFLQSHGNRGNQTLKAGTWLLNGATVKSEDCVKLCCIQKGCDLALQIGKLCYTLACFKDSRGCNLLAKPISKSYIQHKQYNLVGKDEQITRNPSNKITSETIHPEERMDPSGTFEGTEYGVNDTNTKYRVNDTKYGVNDTKYGVNDTKYGVNDTKYGVNDTKYGVNDTKYGGNDTKYGINDKIARKSSKLTSSVPRIPVALKRDDISSGNVRDGKEREILDRDADNDVDFINDNDDIIDYNPRNSDTYDNVLSDIDDDSDNVDNGYNSGVNNGTSLNAANSTGDMNGGMGSTGDLNGGIDNLTESKLPKQQKVLKTEMVKTNPNKETYMIYSDDDLLGKPKTGQISLSNSIDDGEETKINDRSKTVIEDSHIRSNSSERPINGSRFTDRNDTVKISNVVSNGTERSTNKNDSSRSMTSPHRTATRSYLGNHNSTVILSNLVQKDGKQSRENNGSSGSGISLQRSTNLPHSQSRNSATNVKKKSEVENSGGNNKLFRDKTSEGDAIYKPKVTNINKKSVKESKKLNRTSIKLPVSENWEGNDTLFDFDKPEDTNEVLLDETEPNEDNDNGENVKENTWPFNIVSTSPQEENLGKDKSDKDERRLKSLRADDIPGETREKPPKIVLNKTLDTTSKNETSGGATSVKKAKEKLVNSVSDIPGETRKKPSKIVINKTLDTTSKNETSGGATSVKKAKEKLVNSISDKYDERGTSTMNNDKVTTSAIRNNSMHIEKRRPSVKQTSSNRSNGHSFTYDGNTTANSSSTIPQAKKTPSEKRLHKDPYKNDKYNATGTELWSKDNTGDLIPASYSHNSSHNHVLKSSNKTSGFKTPDHNNESHGGRLTSNKENVVSEKQVFLIENEKDNGSTIHHNIDKALLKPDIAVASSSDNVTKQDKIEPKIVKKSPMKKDESITPSSSKNLENKMITTRKSATQQNTTLVHSSQHKTGNTLWQKDKYGDVIPKSMRAKVGAKANEIVDHDVTEDVVDGINTGKRNSTLTKSKTTDKDSDTASVKKRLEVKYNKAKKEVNKSDERKLDKLRSNNNSEFWQTDKEGDVIPGSRNASLDLKSRHLLDYEDNIVPNKKVNASKFPTQPNKATSQNGDLWMTDQLETVIPGLSNKKQSDSFLNPTSSKKQLRPAANHNKSKIKADNDPRKTNEEGNEGSLMNISKIPDISDKLQDISIADVTAPILPGNDGSTDLMDLTPAFYNVSSNILNNETPFLPYGDKEVPGSDYIIETRLPIGHINGTHNINSSEDGIVNQDSTTTRQFREKNIHGDDIPLEEEQTDTTRIISKPQTSDDNDDDVRSDDVKHDDNIVDDAMRNDVNEFTDNDAALMNGVHQDDVDYNDVEDDDVENDDVENDDVNNDDVEDSDVNNDDVEDNDVNNDDVEDSDVINDDGLTQDGVYVDEDSLKKRQKIVDVHHKNDKDILNKLHRNVGKTGMGKMKSVGLENNATIDNKKVASKSKHNNKLAEINDDESWLSSDEIIDHPSLVSQNTSEKNPRKLFADDKMTDKEPDWRSIPEDDLKKLVFNDNLDEIPELKSKKDQVLPRVVNNRLPSKSTLDGNIFTRQAHQTTNPSDVTNEKDVDEMTSNDTIPVSNETESDFSINETARGYTDTKDTSEQLKQITDLLRTGLTKLAVHHRQGSPQKHGEETDKKLATNTTDALAKMSDILKTGLSSLNSSNKGDHNVDKSIRKHKQFAENTSKELSQIAEILKSGFMKPQIRIEHKKAVPKKQNNESRTAKNTIPVGTSQYSGGSVPVHEESGAITNSKRNPSFKKILNHIRRLLRQARSLNNDDTEDIKRQLHHLKHELLKQGKLQSKYSKVSKDSTKKLLNSFHKILKNFVSKLRSVPNISNISREAKSRSIVHKSSKQPAKLHTKLQQVSKERHKTDLCRKGTSTLLKMTLTSGIVGDDYVIRTYASDMDECRHHCCMTSSCDVAMLIESQCRMVDCKHQKCVLSPSEKPSAAVTVRSKPISADITFTGLPLANDKCDVQSHVIANSVLASGGLHGNATVLNHVNDSWSCGLACCKEMTCTVAMIQNNLCYIISCDHEEGACFDFEHNPESSVFLAYVRRTIQPDLKLTQTDSGLTKHLLDFLADPLSKKQERKNEKNVSPLNTSITTASHGQSSEVPLHGSSESVTESYMVDDSRNKVNRGNLPSKTSPSKIIATSHSPSKSIITPSLVSGTTKVPASETVVHKATKHGQCSVSFLATNAKFVQGIQAGLLFPGRSSMKDINDCIPQCCNLPGCNASLLIRDQCYSVECFSEESCQIVQSDDLNTDSTIAIISRGNKEQPFSFLSSQANTVNKDSNEVISPKINKKTEIKDNRKHDILPSVTNNIPISPPSSLTSVTLPLPNNNITRDKNDTTDQGQLTKRVLTPSTPQRNVKPTVVEDTTSQNNNNLHAVELLKSLHGQFQKLLKQGNTTHDPENHLRNVLHNVLKRLNKTEEHVAALKKNIVHHLSSSTSRKDNMVLSKPETNENATSKIKDVHKGDQGSSVYKKTDFVKIKHQMSKIANEMHKKDIEQVSGLHKVLHGILDFLHEHKSPKQSLQRHKTVLKSNDFAQKKPKVVQSHVSPEYKVHLHSHPTPRLHHSYTMLNTAPSHTSVDTVASKAIPKLQATSSKKIESKLSQREQNIGEQVIDALKKAGVIPEKKTEIPSLKEVKIAPKLHNKMADLAKNEEPIVNKDILDILDKHIKDLNEEKQPRKLTEKTGDSNLEETKQQSAVPSKLTSALNHPNVVGNSQGGIDKRLKHLETLVEELRDQKTKKAGEHEESSLTEQPEAIKSGSTQFSNMVEPTGVKSASTMNNTKYLIDQLRNIVQSEVMKQQQKSDATQEASRRSNIRMEDQFKTLTSKAVDEIKKALKTPVVGEINHKKKATKQNGWERRKEADFPDLNKELDVIEHSLVDQSSGKQRHNRPQQHCYHTDIQYDVSLKGGIAREGVQDGGSVNNIQDCIKLCCNDPKCNVAFLLRNNCFLVPCPNKYHCETMQLPTKHLGSQLTFVEHQKSLQIQLRNFDSIVDTLKKSNYIQPPPKPNNVVSEEHKESSQPEVASLIDSDERQARERNRLKEALKPSRDLCAHNNIEHNVTIKGGFTAATYKYHGKVRDINACVQQCCESSSCDIAFMISTNECFSLKCKSKGSCQSIPARSTQLQPRLVRLKTSHTREKLVTPPKKDQSCLTSNPIRHVIPQKSNGVYKDFGKVTRMEECVEYCCAWSNCSLAFMVLDGCFGVSCTNQCPVKQVSATMNDTQVVYVRRRLQVINWITRDSSSRSMLPESPQHVDRDDGTPQANTVINKDDEKLEGDSLHYSEKDSGQRQHGGSDNSILDEDTSASSIASNIDGDMTTKVDSEDGGRSEEDNVMQSEDMLSKKKRGDVIRPRINVQAAVEPKVIDTIGERPQCVVGNIEHDVTLRGGIHSGAFTEEGEVDDVMECVDMCCKNPKCDVAMVIKDICYTIRCYDHSHCNSVPVRRRQYHLKLVHITRDKQSPHDLMEHSRSKGSSRSKYEHLPDERRTSEPVDDIMRHSGITRDDLAIIHGDQRPHNDFIQTLNYDHPKDDYEDHEGLQGLEEGSSEDLEGFQMMKAGSLQDLQDERFQDLLKDKKPSSPLGQTPSYQAHRFGALSGSVDEPYCLHSPISYNVTLRHGLRSGYFKHQGRVDNINTCFRKCCQHSDCDVIYILHHHCYLVTCIDPESCAVEPLLSDSDIAVGFVQRSEHQSSLPVIHQPSYTTKHDNIPPDIPAIYPLNPPDDNVHDSSPVLADGGEETSDNMIDSSQDCIASHERYFVSLRGGLHPNNYVDAGRVSTMGECKNYCCQKPDCDVAFMMKDRCLLVTCPLPHLCDDVHTTSPRYITQSSHMFRSKRSIMDPDTAREVQERKETRKDEIPPGYTGQTSISKSGGEEKLDKDIQMLNNLLKSGLEPMVNQQATRKDGGTAGDDGFNELVKDQGPLVFESDGGKRYGTKQEGPLNDVASGILKNLLKHRAEDSVESILSNKVDPLAKEVTKIPKEHNINVLSAENTPPWASTEKKKEDNDKSKFIQKIYDSVLKKQAKEREKNEGESDSALLDELIENADNSEPGLDDIEDEENNENKMIDNNEYSTGDILDNLVDSSDDPKILTKSSRKHDEFDYNNDDGTPDDGSVLDTDNYNDYTSGDDYEDNYDYDDNDTPIINYPEDDIKAKAQHSMRKPKESKDVWNDKEEQQYVYDNDDGLDANANGQILDELRNVEDELSGLNDLNLPEEPTESLQGKEESPRNKEKGYELGRPVNTKIKPSRNNNDNHQRKPEKVEQGAENIAQSFNNKTTKIEGVKVNGKSTEEEKHEATSDNFLQNLEELEKANALISKMSNKPNEQEVKTENIHNENSDNVVLKELNDIKKELSEMKLEKDNTSKDVTEDISDILAENWDTDKRSRIPNPSLKTKQVIPKIDEASRSLTTNKEQFDNQITPRLYEEKPSPVTATKIDNHDTPSNSNQLLTPSNEDSVDNTMPQLEPPLPQPWINNIDNNNNNEIVQRNHIPKPEPTSLKKNTISTTPDTAVVNTGENEPAMNPVIPYSEDQDEPYSMFNGPESVIAPGSYHRVKTVIPSRMEKTQEVPSGDDIHALFSYKKKQYHTFEPGSRRQNQSTIVKPKIVPTRKPASILATQSLVDQSECHGEAVFYNVDIKGGLSANSFRLYKDISSMEECLGHCCTLLDCDVALMKNNGCYSVHCTSKNMCNVVSGTGKLARVWRKSPVHSSKAKSKISANRGQSLVLYLGFHNVSDTVVLDGSEKENNAKLIAGASIMQYSRHGPGLNLTTGQLVLDGVYFHDQPIEAISIAMWLKLSNTVKNHMLFRSISGENSLQKTSYLLMVEDGHIRWSHENEIGDMVFMLVTPPVVQPNIWYHLVVTYDSTTEKTKALLNGEVQAVGRGHGLLSRHWAHNTFFGSTFNEKHFNGFLDEIYIFGRALSNDEVMRYFQNTDTGNLAVVNISSKGESKDFPTVVKNTLKKNSSSNGVNGLFNELKKADFENSTCSLKGSVYKKWTFRGGLNAGSFTRVSGVNNMPDCIRQCCETSVCDAAVMKDTTCFSLACNTTELCELRPAKLASFDINIAFIKRAPSQNRSTTKLVSSDGPRLEGVSGGKSACVPGISVVNVTINAGVGAGEVVQYRNITTSDKCVEQCCHLPKCNTAFLVQNTCYAISCRIRSFCKVRAPPSPDFVSEVVYLNRSGQILFADPNDALMVVKTIKTNKSDTNNTTKLKFKPKELKMDISTKLLTCQVVKISNNSSLTGGLAAGVFTDHGEVDNIGECIRKCCNDHLCNVTYYMRKKCFTVRCQNDEKCHSVPAKTETLSSLLVYIRHKNISAVHEKTKKKKKTERQMTHLMDAIKTLLKHKRRKHNHQKRPSFKKDKPKTLLHKHVLWKHKRNRHPTRKRKHFNKHRMFMKSHLRFNKRKKMLLRKQKHRKTKVPRKRYKVKEKLVKTLKMHQNKTTLFKKKHKLGNELKSMVVHGENSTMDNVECRKRFGCVFGCKRVLDVGYVCICPVGLKLDGNGRTCSKKESCSFDWHRCQQMCIPDHNKFRCGCYPGFTLNNDGRHCEDINECLLGISKCSHGCHNVLGSYSCKCNKGFVLNPDNITCRDANFVSNDTRSNQLKLNVPVDVVVQYSKMRVLQHQVAVLNCRARGLPMPTIKWASGSDGAYPLAVNHRYHTTAHNSLVIQDANITDSSRYYCIATNILGSKSDFVDLEVIDVDECKLVKKKKKICEQHCHNSLGSYQCSCSNGYQLANDSHSCQDIDECSRDVCSHDCHNTPGSYHCSCHHGYQLIQDHQTCSDINECSTMTHGCSQLCNNTMGGYNCTCIPGYSLSHDNKTCSIVHNTTSSKQHHTSHDVVHKSSKIITTVVTTMITIIVLCILIGTLLYTMVFKRKKSTEILGDFDKDPLRYEKSKSALFSWME